ncbi:E3 ubiquitin-protein ligase HOS1 [Platanthera guangdongensis]|uniref:E3 ubiquitin-protein ligase HOS1 n=1 Tax=Platanthera guangdongensis TaxID=2320717 RepID=A0ABR2LRB5_9ASPA
MVVGNLIYIACTVTEGISSKILQHGRSCSYSIHYGLRVCLAERHNNGMQPISLPLRQIEKSTGGGKAATVNLPATDTHPKVAQVLLERKRSDVALTVLRCTGHDGFSGYDNSVDDEGKFVSLEEALTVLRVRTECGLLTEALCA